MTLRKVPDLPLVGAVRAELDAFGQPLADSALAAVALDLAARLDGEPSDRDAVALARELRIALNELRRQADIDTPIGGDLVARIRATALGN